MNESLLNRLLKLSLLIWLFFAEPAGAVEGNPFLTHFKPPAGVGNHNLAFEQGENGLMYVLNRKGIYTFDGFGWENLGISGRPLAFAYNGSLFYSTDRGIGYFRLNEAGSRDKQMIIEPEETGIIYKLLHTDSGIAAVSPQTIYHIVMAEEPVIDTLFHTGLYEVFISDFFILSGNRYFINNYTDICLVKPGNDYEMFERLPEGEDIVFSFIHREKAFIGSSASKLYSFDGTSLSVFPLEQAAYFGASIMNGAISLGSDQFALSTLNGGCVIIDASDGSTVSILNVLNGLPDDEVYSLGTDKEGGLWISHGMGITRADTGIPVSSFDHFSGLQGNLLSCIYFNGTLYAGCSEGLFYLAEERDYRTIVLPSVRRQSEREPETPTPAPALQPDEPDPVNGAPDERLTRPVTTAGDQEDEKVPEERRGFLSRLISRVTQGIREEIPDESPEESPDESPEKPLSEIASGIAEERDIPPSRRVIHQLQSVSHRYKPVQGVRGKVSHLTVHNGSLFAATNLGIFMVTGETATSIVRGMNITFIEGSGLRENHLLVGTDNGAYLLSGNSIYWSVIPVLEIDNQKIVSMVEIDDSRLLVTTEFHLYLALKAGNGEFETRIIPVPGTDFSSPLVRMINGEIRVFTSEGAVGFGPGFEEVIYDSTFTFYGTPSAELYQKDITWFLSGSEWRFLKSCRDCGGPVLVNLLGLLDDINYIYLADGDTSLYVVNRYNDLYRIRYASADDLNRNIGVFLKRVSEFSGDILNPDNIRLVYSNNSLRIEISAPFYVREKSVMFQYNIAGLTDRWSDWSADPSLEFPFFPPGNYVIRIRARDILGNSSEVLSIPFHVRPPFWQTTWFYIACLAILIILVILIVKRREQKLKRDKAVLEQKVKERTATIEEQKKILQQQRDDLENSNKEITRQKEEIELQRDQIFSQNEEITKSINYASRIQSAVMPSKEIMQDLLGKYFIIFRPRDIVSGDFYWMTKRNGKTVVVASDCTGHGVPGAFMSMMGVSFLNDIVKVAGITQPDLILNELRSKISSILSQDDRYQETSDGMDIAVWTLDGREQSAEFAGAFNPLYLVRDNELIEFKPDKMQVSIDINQNRPFKLQEIKLVTGDRLFLFSDGFADQFGGPSGKKFKTGPFRDLLIRTSVKPLENQQKEIEGVLDNWQAGHDQVDDILLIGIEIS